MGSRKYPSNKIQIGPKKKIALVCSGGGAKAGAFHLGVALALQEYGFKFYSGLTPTDGQVRPPGPMEISCYVGSSAGSIISTFLAAGYTLENIFNSFLSRTSTDPRDTFPKPLPRITYQKMFRLRPELIKEQIQQLMEGRKILKQIIKGEWDSLIEFQWVKMSGLFSTDGLEKFLRNEVVLSNNFLDYLPELFIVATQLNHSRKVVFGKFHYDPPPDDPSCQYNNHVTISQACAASAALPFIFAPYKIASPSGKATWYIDGEIRDTLSTHVAVDSGSDLIISSYTHQPYHYIKKVGSLTKLGLPSILVQSIYLVIEQKINAHIHNKKIQRNAILAVSQYCKQQGIDEEKRRRILEILEAELNHRTEVDSIYIHPKPNDYRMFTREHFSLMPKSMTEVVRSGFRAAIDTLKNYDFADRKVEPAMASTHAASLNTQENS